MGQGFFTRVTGAGPVTFTFTDALRLTSYANPTHYRALGEQRPLLGLTLQRADAPAAEQASAFVYFQSDATAEVDELFDGAQPGHNAGDVPTLVSLTARGEELVINGLPESLLRAGTTVELLLDLPQAGIYKLGTAQLHNLQGSDAALLDRLTNTRYNLHATTSVSFTVAEPGEVRGRFVIIFGQRVTGTADVTRVAALGVFPNPAAPGASVRITGAEAGAPVQLLDATGRVVRLARATNGGDMVLDLKGLSAGVYTVRVGTATQRLVVE
jgi:hypothetical protein